MAILTKKEMVKSKNFDFSMKQETAFFSNYLEELYEKLKKHLFSHLSLYSLIYVFVPSDKVKQWLMKRLAQDEGILGGVSFCTLFDLLPLFKKESFPDIFDLELILQEEIFLKTSQNQKEEIDEPLWSFLEEGGGFSPKRVVQLSQILSELFFHYGLYGKEMISSWGKPKSWQEALWFAIFSRKKWKIPLLDLFSLENRTFEKNVHIHLFAPHHLPSLYREFLHSLSMQYPIYFYLLSPTYCFWEDLASDRERRSLLHFWKRKNIPQERREELDSYLQDRNPLLANLGKAGREALKILDRDELQIEESYVLIKRDSLLHSLQEDLLSLKNPSHEEKEKVLREDKSLQIHQASSLFREIEILYDFLLKKIECEKISFSDVLVVAPDISLYEPFIHQVFKGGQIPYRIFDLPLCEKSNFAMGLRDFFHLVHSRWAKEDLLPLFENIALLHKHPLDLKELTSWLVRAGLTWGIDGKHRAKFIETKKEVSQKGTWQDVLDRILEGFVFCKEEKDLLVPAFFFEKSSAPLLDRFLFLFDRLREDIAFLEKSPLLSLEEAADFFEEAASFYFAIDQEKAAEQKAFSLFQEALKKMRQTSRKFEKKKFLVETLFSQIWKKMQGSFATPSSFLEMVEFRSFKEGAFVPSSIVCLLGLKEDFPRNEQKSSLDLLFKEKKREFFPSQNENDRALFLEAILSARNTLYISIPSAKDSEGRSLLVEELLSYLESRFFFEKDLEDQVVTLHPHFSFDRMYFEKKPAFENFSHACFRASQSFYREKKKEKNIWEEETPSSLEEVIDVKSLELLSSHPIKFFFQKGLKIFLEEEKKESFSLSSLDRHSLRASLWKNERNEILDSMEKNGAFFSGTFHEILKTEAEKELLSYEENLLSLGVDKKRIFSVDMIEGCEEPFQKENGHWTAPPLELARKKKKIKIVGRLDGLSPQGILHHGTGLFWDWIRFWPRLLIYWQFDFLEKGDCLFSKNPKKKKFFIENALSVLGSYLDYYEKAKKTPSPLLREWAQPFFLGPEELDAAIHKETMMKRSDDPYLHRLFFLSERPSASFLHEHWKEILFQAFEPLLAPFLEKSREEDGIL